MRDSGFFGTLALCVLGIIAALLIQDCEEKDCRARHGQWATGWVGGKWAGLCVEPEEE